MFCFFVNLEALGVGEDERLRFVLVVVVVTVVTACWSAEVKESEEEVDDRLVLAAEGFCAELAWRVTLESLDTWVGLAVTTLVVLVTVGFGGLEKSTSEDSPSDEIDSEEDEDEDEDDDEDASAFVVVVVVSVDLGDPLSNSLSDDELSEEGPDSALAIAVVAAAGLAGLAGLAEDPLSDDEVSEEEEDSADGLEIGTLF